MDGQTFDQFYKSGISSISSISSSRSHSRSSSSSNSKCSSFCSAFYYFCCYMNLMFYLQKSIPGYCQAKIYFPYLLPLLTHRFYLLIKTPLAIAKPSLAMVLSICSSICLFVCLSPTKTRFSQKVSNLEVWSPLTTYRKS